MGAAQRAHAGRRPPAPGRIDQLSLRGRPAHACDRVRRITGQSPHPSSTLAVEFPRTEGDPYYPIPRDDTRALYRKYEALANELDDVTFVGRLARYQYLNMDQVVGQALSAFAKLSARALV